MTTELALTHRNVSDSSPTTSTSFIRLRGHLLDHKASMDVRAACLSSLDRGVTHVFVDLTGLTRICAEATDMLDAAADELRTKHGALWIASFERSPEWHAVPIEGLSGMKGLSIALDAALTTRHPLPSVAAESNQERDDDR